jgi:uncharacterized protein DUF2845
MKILMLTCLSILLTGLSSTASAAGETLRCGSKIVKTGMMMEEVRKFCGEPTSIEVIEHDVRSGNRVTGTTYENIWVYRRGSNKPAKLHFDNDKLLSIRYER